MTTFILVVHTLIAAALVGVILIQRSEGGGLGIGGGPTGLMTARGAANLLTRATTILATLFIGTSILLAVLSAMEHKKRVIDTSLLPATSAPATPAAPATPIAPTGPAAPAADGSLFPRTQADEGGISTQTGTSKQERVDQVPIAE